ncbi:MAG: transglycosylase domain-containing protein [Clostridia bacterium]|nr:transglycosylase domain-containing protein [Clostridia bacterium]
MKKFLKWSMIILGILLALALGGLGLYVSSVYINASTIELNEEVLSSPSLTLQVFDSDNKPIKEENQINKAYAKLETLNPHTIDAFLSIEDKDFYKHSGVNYKRIAKAMVSNLKSRSFKEGASTITQQLVKNTHLTSEKTIVRKIKEVALAKKLEKSYSKDEILELYLNVVYFGNNCYGIESASNYYFSKPAKDLSVIESATLSAMLKSPAKYSPIKNPKNSLSRRNLVMKQMMNCGKLSEVDYYKLKEQKTILKLNKESHNRLNSFSQASIDEAEKIMGLPARQLAINGYKIYTSQNQQKQKALEKAFSQQELSCDSAGIVIDNEKGAVEAYIGNSSYKILDAKRQPGSCIKPVLVYSPALNEDIIYPCTQILDEKVTIGDYSPKNVGDVYRGYVSVREALSKSMNIPSVKVLSYVGIDKAKAYAQDMGFTFDENDTSYTLALGGMTYGVNILQLCGAYSTFANGGNFIQPKFVSYITDKNGKIVYINDHHSSKVLREDSAYLITDMLKTCAQSGTAKRLAELDCEIASKTGTVGKSGSKENLDAWNVSYTKAQTCGVWLGELDNTPILYAGGNQPTEIVKSYFAEIGDNSHFEKPNSIVERKIDSEELSSNHRVVLANTYIPERYTKTETFSVFNLPTEISQKFTKVDKVKVASRVENGNAVIEFDAKDFMTYKIESEGKTIQTISGKDGLQKVVIPLLNERQKVCITNFYTLMPELIERQEISFLRKQPTQSNKWYI